MTFFKRVRQGRTPTEADPDFLLASVTFAVRAAVQGGWEAWERLVDVLADVDVMFPGFGGAGLAGWSAPRFPDRLVVDLAVARVRRRKILDGSGTGAKSSISPSADAHSSRALHRYGLGS